MFVTLDPPATHQIRSPRAWIQPPAADQAATTADSVRRTRIRGGLSSSRHSRRCSTPPTREALTCALEERIDEDGAAVTPPLGRATPIVRLPRARQGQPAIAAAAAGLHGGLRPTASRAAAGRRYVPPPPRVPRRPAWPPPLPPSEGVGVRGGGERGARRRVPVVGVGAPGIEREA